MTSLTLSSCLDTVKYPILFQMCLQYNGDGEANVIHDYAKNQCFVDIVTLTSVEADQALKGRFCTILL